MQPFHFKRAEAERVLADPDGALRPVNAYSDADELNGLVDDALLSGVIERQRPGAHFALYPMSLSEPDPIVAVSLGSGPALLGHPVKMRQREGESPLEFTLRLLEDLAAEANELAGSVVATRSTAGDPPAADLSLRCPDCCSEEALPVDRGRRLRCGNCGAAFAREEALVTAADAEQQPAVCACSEVRGCPSVSSESLSDREALDALAAKLREPGEWNGGDLCELAAELLRRSGRPIAEGRDKEGIRS